MDSHGYLFKINNRTRHKIFWKCRAYDRQRCYAKATTKDFYVTNWAGCHNHPPPEEDPCSYQQYEGIPSVKRIR